MKMGKKHHSHAAQQVTHSKRHVHSADPIASRLLPAAILQLAGVNITACMSIDLCKARRP